MANHACKVLLKKKTTGGDCGLLASTMNKFFLSVRDQLPILNMNNQVSTVNGDLPDQYVISEFSTLKTLESVKVNKATSLETFLRVC